MRRNAVPTPAERAFLAELRKPIEPVGPISVADARAFALQLLGLSEPRVHDDLGPPRARGEPTPCDILRTEAHWGVASMAADNLLRSNMGDGCRWRRGLRPRSIREAWKR